MKSLRRLVRIKDWVVIVLFVHVAVIDWVTLTLSGVGSRLGL